MIVEPPISKGNLNPIRTTTGVNATLKPWSRFTLHSGIPFERAVVINSLARTSSIDDLA